MTQTKRQTKQIKYAFALSETKVGHGAFMWAFGGRSPKEDLLEVTPKGFRLFGKDYSSLDRLIRWFKHEGGWKTSAKDRKDWFEREKQAQAKRKETRGADVLEDARKKARKLFGPEVPAPGTTFGAASGTPSGFFDAGGMRTPHLGAYSAPGTPMFHSAPGTPSFRPASPTPGGFGGGGGMP